MTRIGLTKEKICIFIIFILFFSGMCFESIETDSFLCNSKTNGQTSSFLSEMKFFQDMLRDAEEIASLRTLGEMQTEIEQSFSEKSNFKIYLFYSLMAIQLRKFIYLWKRHRKQSGNRTNSQRINVWYLHQKAGFWG